MISMYIFHNPLALKYESNQNLTIECDDEMANEIREVMEELIQEIGFDENYEPNKDGEVIETLIDKFFIE